MKTYLSIIALLLSLVFVAPAHAAAVLVDHSLYDLSPNQSGLLENTGSDTYSGIVKGLLPAQTKITFTYLLTGPLSTTGLSSLYAAGDVYIGTGLSGDFYTSDTMGNNVVWPSNSMFSSSLPLESMPIRTYMDGSTMTTEIQNWSAEVAGFESAFTGFLASGILDLTGVSYQVSSVSAVPLPAALPLFGLALVGMAGYRRHKKKAA